MRLSQRPNEVEWSKLQARYRAAWKHFAGEVRHWQALQAQGWADTFSLREAEIAARLAERQYRQARNAWADYLLEGSFHHEESLLVGSR